MYKLDVNQKSQSDAAPQSEKKKKVLAPVSIASNPSMDDSYL